MFNLRIAATQNCNNPSVLSKISYFTYLELLNIHKFHPKGPLSKISYFTYLELLNIHKFHPKGPFPIKWPI